MAWNHEAPELVSFFSTPKISLPGNDPNDQERARQLLRALAAQVRPVMKSHGLEINRLEEVNYAALKRSERRHGETGNFRVIQHEYNTVFVGRNMNNGAIIELVLRGPDGSFRPVDKIVDTLCHELAHIKYMNHGPEFQALCAQFKEEVKELQANGYFGDGYWSPGTRLCDSTRVSGIGIDQSIARVDDGKKPRERRVSSHSRQEDIDPGCDTVPGTSLPAGQQTVYQRTAITQSVPRDAFPGEGNRLVEVTPSITSSPVPIVPTPATSASAPVVELQKGPAKAAKRTISERLKGLFNSKKS